MSAKVYEVHVPISGYMRVHLRADNVEEALQEAHKIAIDIHKDTSEEVIPNLFTWKLDSTVCPIVIERGESDE